MQCMAYGDTYIANYSQQEHGEDNLMRKINVISNLNSSIEKNIC